MRSRIVPGGAALALGLVLLATGIACKNAKKEEPRAPAPREITGLDAIPGEVTAVIGANVRSLRSSWLVSRAVSQMMRRDPELEVRVAQLITDCKFDPRVDLDEVIIGIGDGPGGEAVMVMTGRFVEAELASCVGQSVAGDGGRLTTQPVAGRTFYHAGGRTGRSESVWFTLSGPRTLVLATSSDWLARAVGDGPKVLEAPDSAEWIALAQRSADIWVAGAVDAQIGASLLELTGTSVGAPPRALFGTADLAGGAKLVLGARMDSEKDAKSLVSLIKGQLALGALVAQRHGLGTLLGKLGVDSEGKTVYLRLSLSEDELRQVLARVDPPAEPSQNSTEH